MGIQGPVGPQGEPVKPRRRILFVPDTHAPYHDEKAWKLMMGWARKFKPDIVITLGDFVDCYSVSSHSKSPSRRVLLAEELRESSRLVRELESLGAKKYIWVMGNHCNRISRYVAERAPDLHGIFSLEESLKLDTWEVVEYRRHIRVGKLFVTHDVGSAGADAAAKAARLFNGSCVIGHIHRMGITYTRNARGEAHVAASFGWLGSPLAGDYLHEQQLSAWTTGFGSGLMDSQGRVHLRCHPIVDGAVYG